MKVSIVVPTYNEEDVIGDCIKSLYRQSYTDIEIIIVDDGSTDGTVTLVNNFKNIQLYKQKHKGPGSARNLGSSKSGGDILVFVDADMTFDENFISNLVEPIIKGKTKGTFSKEEYVSNWDNVWARCWNVNEGWEKKKRHKADYPDKQRVFRAILKKEFDRVNGFTPGGYTDDWSLYEKLGYRAINAPNAKFYHKNPSDLKEIFSHSKWVAKREYKLGSIGVVISLVRASFPVSVVVGAIKSLINLMPSFLVFKIIYDFGIFIGLLESKIFNNLVK
ncbi:glycosyltransferase family 2 protein [Patescibacteria group bacterium]